HHGDGAAPTAAAEVAIAGDRAWPARRASQRLPPGRSLAGAGSPGSHQLGAAAVSLIDDGPQGRWGGEIVDLLSSGVPSSLTVPPVVAGAPVRRISDTVAKAVLFILKGYPRLSETFIAQEIRALEMRGLDIRIVSLRHPTDRAVHP